MSFSDCYTQQRHAKGTETHLLSWKLERSLSFVRSAVPSGSVWILLTVHQEVGRVILLPTSNLRKTTQTSVLSHPKERQAVTMHVVLNNDRMPKHPSHTFHLPSHNTMKKLFILCTELLRRKTTYGKYGRTPGFALG